MREEELNQYWKTVVDTIAEGVMIVAPGGIIVAANRALLQLLGYELAELVPNYYRSELALDRDRMQTVKNSDTVIPLRRNVSKAAEITSGLQNSHIALWHSHGWYYNMDLDRWEWERPRLWQTVEDIYPLSYTIPFLVPMLENAGAVVMLPRERDR